MEAKSFRIEGTPADPLTWNIILCSFGAFGTIYEHASPVITTLAIQQNVQTPSLTIDHITSRSSVTVTNVININLRQKVGSELSWVTIVNGPTGADVSFDLCTV